MKLKVSVFEYLNQKVMYIQDVNYYFGIRDNFDIKLGDYELSEEEVLNIAKENDPEEYEVFINTSIEERLNKIKTYDIEEIKEQIELITDAESANNFIAQIDNFEHVGSSKQMAAKLVANKAKSLNLKLNSEKKYEPAA